MQRSEVNTKNDDPVRRGERNPLARFTVQEDEAIE